MKIRKSTVQHNPEILGKNDKSIKVALEKAKFLKELNIRSTIEVKGQPTLISRAPYTQNLVLSFSHQSRPKKKPVISLFILQARVL